MIKVRSYELAIMTINRRENMKDYAFVGYFDIDTENHIRDIWAYLYDNNISDYGYLNVGRRPHITFASYQNINEDDFINMLNEFYEDKASVEINLSQIGAFLNTQTLFLAPVVNENLHLLHSSHHAKFNEFDSENGKYYKSWSWVPHTTIASRLASKEMERAHNYCLENIPMLKGRITSVALIYVEKNAEGIFFKDNIRVEVPLRNI